MCLNPELCAQPDAGCAHQPYQHGKETRLTDQGLMKGSPTGRGRSGHASSDVNLPPKEGFSSDVGAQIV